MRREFALTDDVRRGLGEAFLVNDRVNQLLLENLDAEAWREKPPGGVRTIAAIFSHMHNVRRKWLRLSSPHLKLPAELSWSRCTQKQAAKALKESAQLCAEMLSDVRVTEFVRDGWAKPWDIRDPSTTLGAGSQAEALRANTKTPGAVMMLAYMVSHEAHHRGQVCMLAHQMGYRLPMKVMSKMWAWEGLALRLRSGQAFRRTRFAPRDKSRSFDKLRMTTWPVEWSGIPPLPQKTRQGWGTRAPGGSG